MKRDLIMFLSAASQVQVFRQEQDAPKWLTVTTCSLNAPLQGKQTATDKQKTQVRSQIAWVEVNDQRISSLSRKNLRESR